MRRRAENEIDFLECKWPAGLCTERVSLDYLKEADADIFCIQESKLQEGQVDLETSGI